MEGGSRSVLIFFFFSLTYEIECHFIRCLPINNLVQGPYPAVLAYRL